MLKNTIAGLCLVLLGSQVGAAPTWTLTDLRNAGYWATGVSSPDRDRRVAEPGILHFELRNFRYTDRYLCTIRFDTRTGVRSSEACARLRPGESAESRLADSSGATRD